MFRDQAVSWTTDNTLLSLVEPVTEEGESAVATGSPVSTPVAGDGVFLTEIAGKRGAAFVTER